MPGRRTAILSAAAVAAVAAAGTAIAQPATINWQESFKSSAPENNPTINTGETVTWNVTQGGHNVDVMGPENFKSTSGTDKSGTQFAHTFTKAGKYTYLCDYHSGMHGTITVVDPPPPPPPPPSGGGSGSGSGGSGQPAPSGGGSSQPVSGGGAATSGAPASAGSASAPGAVDAAAPAVQRVSLRRGTLRVRLAQPAKLTIRLRRVGAHRVAKHVVAGRAGVNTLRLSRWMRSAGRYHVSVVATDAAGNVSRPLRLALSR